MKKKKGLRVAIWIVVLIATTVICNISVKVERASHAPSIFALGENPLHSYD